MISVRAGQAGHDFRDYQYASPRLSRPIASPSKGKAERRHFHHPHPRTRPLATPFISARNIFANSNPLVIIYAISVRATRATVYLFIKFHTQLDKPSYFNFLTPAWFSRIRTTTIHALAPQEFLFIILSCFAGDTYEHCCRIADPQYLNKHVGGGKIMKNHALFIYQLSHAASKA
jgi:hypothetical protein